MVPSMCFYGFQKNLIFAKYALVLAYGFNEDHMWQKLTKTLYVSAMAPIFWIGSS
jgi:hypothetical protein